MPRLLQVFCRLATLRWLCGLPCALAMMLGAASTASALERVQTKTRVGGFELASSNSTGLSRSATPRTHPGFSPAQTEEASGSLLAAKEAPQLTREAVKSISSLEERLAEHQSKLDAFRKNPDAFDNKGFLKNAPSQEVRERIIQGRVRHLEQEIRNFQQQIDRLRAGGGQ